jgi:hypothetical protein
MPSLTVVGVAEVEVVAVEVAGVEVVAAEAVGVAAAEVAVQEEVPEVAAPVDLPAVQKAKAELRPASAIRVMSALGVELSGG